VHLDVLQDLKHSSVGVELPVQLEMESVIQFELR